MEKNLSNDEAIKKMKEMAESVGICIYTSINDDKQLNGRPMGTAKIEDDGTFWFFTSDYSGAAHLAASQKDVLLSYSSPAKNTYVTVNGGAELSYDKAKMQELWTPMMKTWFPQGLETPDIALLCVKPTSAHYWDSDISRLSLLYSFVVAQVTGKRPDTAGEYGELDMNTAAK